MSKYLVYLWEPSTRTRSHMYAHSKSDLISISNNLPETIEICEITEIETLDNFATVSDVLMDRRRR